jgi:hypothetical protein
MVLMVGGSVYKLGTSRPEGTNLLFLILRYISHTNVQGYFPADSIVVDE